MTNTELQEKIAHLEAELAEVKEMAEAMKKRVDGGVSKPEDRQKYWYVSGSGEVYTNHWTNHIMDHNYHLIGNCFPTKQAGEATVRVRKLIQKARESQDGFVPDWGDGEQDKYSLHFHDSRMWTAHYTLLNVAPIFGFWEDRSMCEQFIDKNRDDLLWFFTEYKR